MTADPRRSLLLALADDELVIGHRTSEWTGWVPYIEEDLALSSIAQDEIGHARALYEILAGVEGGDPDALAFGRAPGEYRNAIVCERPNGDFAHTLARHYLYDTADAARLEALGASSFADLASLVRVMRMEEAYHLEHARAWVRRLALGPVDARMRLEAALGRLLGEAAAIFEPVEDEEELVGAGVMPLASAEMAARWVEGVRADLDAVDLGFLLSERLATVAELVPTASGAAEAPPEGTTAVVATATLAIEGVGGRRGAHSEDFEPMWAEMTFMHREHPGARW